MNCERDLVKVTIITSYYLPDITSHSNYYKDIATDLSEQGIDVTLVCGIPVRFIKKETTEYYAKNDTQVINENLRIIRTGPKKPAGNSLLSKAVYNLYRSLCIYNKAKKISTDVYFICSSPPFLGFFGAFLSKRAKTIYDLHDMFPDILITSGKAKEKSLLIKALRKFEQFIYKHNTHIRVISQDMAETLKSKGVADNKVSLIYNWIDENEAKYVKRQDNPLFDILQISREGFYVCYAGNIGYLQNLSTLISAAGILEKSEPQIQFLIIGDGAWKPEMLKMIKDKGVKNIQTFPMQDIEHTPFVYSLADAGVVTIKSGVSKGSLPSKTWNIMSASRPVICEADEGSELWRIIAGNRCGLCVAPGDVQGFANAAMTLYNDREQSGCMGKNARAYIESNITRKESTKKLLDCIMSVYDRRVQD